MALTTRDVQVINFIDETNLLMTAQQIARYFYRSGATQNMQSSLVIARRRLTVMAKGRYIKRIREFSNQEYIYYSTPKPPKKLEHKLLMSEFLTTMKENGFNLLSVKVEFMDLQKKYHLRPDMRVEFERFGTKYIAMVEVDRTKTYSNYEKYEAMFGKYKTDHDVREALSPRFILVSVCDVNPGIDMVYWVKTDMSNFSKFKYEFDN